jgi:hypothetical protein
MAANNVETIFTWYFCLNGYFTTPRRVAEVRWAVIFFAGITYAVMLSDRHTRKDIYSPASVILALFNKLVWRKENTNGAQRVPKGQR